MVISVVPTNANFEKKVLYLPPEVSWEIELRRNFIELDHDLGEYRSYGLYLKSTDGVNSCLFHSEMIEEEVEEFEVEDEDVRLLFDGLMNDMFQEIGSALADKSGKVDLGHVIDLCMEDWMYHISLASEADETE